MCFTESYYTFCITKYILDTTEVHYVPVFVYNFLIFGNERLYVMEKGIMSARIGLEVFKSDLLLRLSTLLV